MIVRSYLSVINTLLLVRTPKNPSSPMLGLYTVFKTKSQPALESPSVSLVGSKRSAKNLVVVSSVTASSVRRKRVTSKRWAERTTGPLWPIADISKRKLFQDFSQKIKKRFLNLRNFSFVFVFSSSSLNSMLGHYRNILKITAQPTIKTSLRRAGP